MWPVLTIDFVICGAALGLAIGTIVWPSKRWLKVNAVVSLVIVMAGYVVLRPSARAALIYYQNMGGVASADWHAGVDSLQAVWWPFTAHALVAAILLAIIALKTK